MLTSCLSSVGEKKELVTKYLYRGNVNASKLETVLSLIYKHFSSIQKLSFAQMADV